MTTQNWEIDSLNRELLIDNINDSIKSNSVFYQKNAFSNFLNWEDFIKILDYQYNNSEISPGNNPAHRVITESKKVTNISKYTDFHYHMLELASSNMVNPTIYKDLPIVEEVMSYLKSVISLRFTLKGLINFVGNGFEGSFHDDVYHVFSMQHIGTVKYNIKDEDGTLTTYDLEPGDIIFMPSGIKHSISAPESRGTLIIDIEKYA